MATLFAHEATVLQRIQEQRDVRQAQVKRAAKSEADASKLRHSQGIVYERLFGVLPETTHTAEADVAALAAIITHEFVWARVVDSTHHAVEWRSLKQHFDQLLHAHLQSVRGWRLEDCPSCRHGPKRPTSSKTADGSWQVTFTCVVASATSGYVPEGQCRQEVKGDHPTFKEDDKRSDAAAKPKKAAAASASKEKRGGQDKGECGACNCRTMCRTSACPCFAAKTTCSTSCQHGRSARSSAPCKCTNGAKPVHDAAEDAATASAPQQPLRVKKPPKKRSRVLIESDSSESEFCSGEGSTTSGEASLISDSDVE